MLERKLSQFNFSPMCLILKLTNGQDIIEILSSINFVSKILCYNFNRVTKFQKIEEAREKSQNIELNLSPTASIFELSS